MEFTSGQQEAIRKMKEWWKSQGKQTFEISGWAGTGKSTIVDYLIKEIGLERSEVVFLTYTGKAALVLTRKGVPAQTIHSLIYEVREEMVKKKDKYGNDILNAKGEPVMEIKRFFRKVYWDTFRLYSGVLHWRVVARLDTNSISEKQQLTRSGVL